MLKLVDELRNKKQEYFITIGFVRPSREDISITHRLFQVGQLVGINVIDHIILGKNDYYSFKEHRILADHGET